MTARDRRHVPTHKVVADLNDYLRGWRQYYRFGNSTVRFSILDHYVDEHTALLLSKRHARRVSPATRDDHEGDTVGEHEFVTMLSPWWSLLAS
jgi:Group II intron, maturase-specific domain